MQLCKLAARVIARHRGLLAIYVLMLAAFGGLMASYAGTDDAAYQQTRPTVAVIDRDGSTISKSIAAFASKAGTQVELSDSTYALQDAAAKDLATYVLVIPEGYGEALAAAAQADAKPPALECSVSFRNAQGSLMDERVRAFAQQLYALLQVGDTTAEQAVAWAEEAQTARAEVALTPQEATGLPLAYLIFMQFSTYALFGGTAILIASGLRSLARNRPVHARLCAAGVPDAAREAQLALACAGVGVTVWAAMVVLGAIWCAPSLAGVDVELIALAQVPLLALGFVGAAYGYLLWSLGAPGDLAHAAGNMGSMVLTFLGGTWVSQASMGAEITAVARLTPIWWVVHSLEDVYSASGATGELVGSVMSQTGLVMLFAVAIAAAGAAIARTRARG